MQLDAFLDQMTPAIHQSLKQSVELGKWPDGRTMSMEERDASLQAVIVYEHQHLPESDRVGYIAAKYTPSGKKNSEKKVEDASILRFQDA